MVGTDFNSLANCASTADVDGPDNVSLICFINCVRFFFVGDFAIPDPFLGMTICCTAIGWPLVFNYSFLWVIASEKLSSEEMCGCLFLFGI